MMYGIFGRSQIVFFSIALCLLGVVKPSDGLAYDMELQVSICQDDAKQAFLSNQQAQVLWNDLLEGLSCQNLSTSDGVHVTGLQVHYDVKTAEGGFLFYQNGLAPKFKFSLTEGGKATTSAVVKSMRGDDKKTQTLALGLADNSGKNVLSASSEFDLNPAFLRLWSSVKNQNELVQTRFQTSLEAKRLLFPFSFFEELTHENGIYRAMAARQSVHDLCNGPNAEFCPFVLGQRLLLNAFAARHNIPMHPLPMPEQAAKSITLPRGMGHLEPVGILKFQKYNWRRSSEQHENKKLPPFNLHAEFWTRLDASVERGSFVELSVKAKNLPDAITPYDYQNWIADKIAGSGFRVCQSKPTMVDFLQQAPSILATQD